MCGLGRLVFLISNRSSRIFFRISSKRDMHKYSINVFITYQLIRSMYLFDRQTELIWMGGDARAVTHHEVIRASSQQLTPFTLAYVVYNNSSSTCSCVV